MIDIDAILKDIPAKTGVYLFRNSKGEVLYVGKAVNLRSRVRSYFREGADSRDKTRFLANKTKAIDYQLADSEKEALILENTLIKEHRPRYNIDLKDDKDFICIKLTTLDKYPRLVVIRRPTGKEKEPIFGPYHSAIRARETIKFLMRMFPLRTCANTKFRSRTRPCLNYQIGKCPGPCMGHINEEEYGKRIKAIKAFLRGRIEEVVAELSERMDELSDDLKFEEAGQVRDQIRAIEKTVEKQKVFKAGGGDRDVLGFARKKHHAAVHKIYIRAGRMLSGKSYVVQAHAFKDEEVFGDFVKQHYANVLSPPSEVVVDLDFEDRDTLEAILRDKLGMKVSIIVPQKGDKRGLVNLAKRQAGQALERSERKAIESGQATEELERSAFLSKPPTRIECFDISNIMGNLAVGSRVSFLNGEPEKARYRRYRIKTVPGQDDYAMMYEVLSRRFTRGRRENDLPDLIMVDGGKGQLEVARRAMKDTGIKTDLLALAKGEDHTSGADKVYIPGRKNPVKMKSAALHLLARVRDESHRFAIEYHRKIRSKEGMRGILEEIPGIGPRKRRMLLKSFGSLKAIKEADIETLSKVNGISERDAETVVNFFTNH